MSYASRKGRRPAEYASKSSHGHVINDLAVQNFLSDCNIPKRADEIEIAAKYLEEYSPIGSNPIRYIIAIDGGYEEIPVQTAFPSATICFFQFGAIVFSISDLETLEDKPFLDPEDLAKLKQIQRLKLTIPVRNVTLKGEASLTSSVRRAIYDFFCQKLEDEELLIDTLRWFVFEEYGSPIPTWTLGTCPVCDTASIPLQRAIMSKDYTFTCSSCSNDIYLTDVFRLHEAIDDEIGAGGILGYVTTTFEQILLLHVIRLILKLKPALLKQILFIKDGPLAFFGQTANMHKPMRALIKWLFEKHNLFLAGLEKSGPFVEHADEIANKLPGGSFLILDNDYIYKYILPGKADPSAPYGRSTYYGNKVIFKTLINGIHVVSIPTIKTLAYPMLDDFHNLPIILTNVEKLKCDMYDNALLPVALANKLVSLAQYPSSRILQRFAVTTMNP